MHINSRNFEGVIDVCLLSILNFWGTCPHPSPGIDAHVFNTGPDDREVDEDNVRDDDDDDDDDRGFF